MIDSKLDVSALLQVNIMMIVSRDFAARHASASELETFDPGLPAREVDAPDAQGQGLEGE